MEQIKQLLESKFTETNTKIEAIQVTINNDVAGIKDALQTQSNRIDQIENELQNKCEVNQFEDIAIQIEILKQERLRNNVRLTGLPNIAFENPTKTIMQIDRLLELRLLPTDVTAYADRNHSSLIVSFNNYVQKRRLLDKMRERRTLLAEEIFTNVRSNSPIYINDQLTPYFASLFKKAWQAKKDKLLVSVSSLGGRIRVKKTATSTIVNIECETDLHNAIYYSDDSEHSTELEQNNCPSQQNEKTPGITQSAEHGSFKPDSDNQQEKRSSQRSVNKEKEKELERNTNNKNGEPKQINNEREKKINSNGHNSGFVSIPDNRNRIQHRSYTQRGNGRHFSKANHRGGRSENGNRGSYRREYNPNYQQNRGVDWNADEW